MNLILCIGFGMVCDKCSFHVGSDSASVLMCFGYLSFLKKKKSSSYIKNLQKSFVAELKNAHESERKSIEDSFKEKQELLEVHLGVESLQI